ncbi:hypothetical protein HNR46_000333 [Haloferula luteola]|uniref:Uncharacterized protein n=1 Tax=Haloferula luteola TaxID=595692 RepID=A0A840UWE9_9BACT|nr:hypothetical protein [Haloferula luteola]
MTRWNHRIFGARIFGRGSLSWIKIGHNSCCLAIPAPIPQTPRNQRFQVFISTRASPFIMQRARCFVAKCILQTDEFSGAPLARHPRHHGSRIDHHHPQPSQIRGIILAGVSRIGGRSRPSRIRIERLPECHHGGHCPFGGECRCLPCLFLGRRRFGPRSPCAPSFNPGHFSIGRSNFVALKPAPPCPKTPPPPTNRPKPN